MKYANLKHIIRYRRALENESGIALLVVLWIMTLMIVMVFSFSVAVRTEIFSTITSREQTENKYLARAGLQHAIMETYFNLAGRNNILTFSEQEICRADGSLYDGQLGGGYYKFRISDEAGKININNLTDSSGIILNNLLVNLGLDKETADTIVDSILDWKDADDLHRLHGAESDYYLSLPVPYKTEDGYFDSLEELLLVKGMTAEILYGEKERPGLINFLTIHSGTGRININTAAPEILKAIPSMSDDLMRKILAYRIADNTRKDGADMQAILAGAEYAKISHYVSTSNSNVYSMEAFGYQDKEKSKKNYPIKAVIMIEGANPYRVLDYQSPANIKQ